MYICIYVYMYICIYVYMYICIYVDSLLVALIFKVWLLRRFGPPIWGPGGPLASSLGSSEGRAPPIWGPRKALALQFGVPGKLWASKLVMFRFWGVFRARFGGPGGSFWSTILPNMLKIRDLKTLCFGKRFGRRFLTILCDFDRFRIPPNL